MKKLVQFAVNYPVTILMITLAVVLLGWISWGKLGVDLFPDLNNPRIYVEIKAGDRPPEEMEKMFVTGMEALAIRQKDVLQVSSVCRTGTARITVEFTWNKDMDEAFLDIQKAMNTFAQNREIDELNITRHDPNSAPVMLLAMTSDRITDMNELRKMARNYVRNELVLREGVADVELSGGEEAEVLITTDRYRLGAFGLTMSDLANSIRSYNRNVSGGTIEENNRQYIVKGVSLLRNLQDFEDIIVGYKPLEKSAAASAAANVKKVPVFLREVASVEIKNKKPVNIVRLNGQRCIGLSVFKETRYNTVKAVEQINRAVDKMEKSLPGVHFYRISDQGAYISSAIGEVKSTALLGIVLAIFVLFLFLRRVGTTLIISIAIPVSIIATFNLMYFGRLTINIMTLGGLALGAGMLVDNAIVVMENIFRNHQAGLPVKEAAVRGTAQVGGAITASTLTTIVVFLPIVYLHGPSGELFKDEAWTVAFSLLSSLFVAIFLIPMLYYFFFRNKPATPVRFRATFEAYGRFLDKALARKGLILLLAAVLVTGSLLLLPVVGTEFMPPAGTREYNLEVKLPEGTTLARTSATLADMEDMIRQVLGDNIETLYSHTGKQTGTGGDIQAVFQGENDGMIKVILKKESPLRPEQVTEALRAVSADIPEVSVRFTPEESVLKNVLGLKEAPVVIQVSGEDREVLEHLAGEVMSRVRDIDGLYNIRSSVEEGSPEVLVKIDKMRAGMFNLNVATVTEQIKNQLEGVNAGETDRKGEMSDITLKLPEKDLAALQDMVVHGPGGEVRLNEIAVITKTTSPKELFRRNQSRVVRIYARLAEGTVLDKVAGEIRARMARIELPANYRITLSGEEEKRQASMRNLGFALLLSVVLVYMVLASQFESLIHPFTILLTIPLAVTGSILLFWLLGMPLNMMAIIGIILLTGIAVNDSIILVDRINQLQREEGLPRTEAIREAGKQRLRPILMTSLTTILALLPLTIGFGENVALRSSMALAVIGGLVTSTLLTLVVIPCVYDLLDRVRGMVKR